MRDWTVKQSLERYGLDRWGDGFFGVNERGRVEVRPSRDAASPIDLMSLVDELRGRGMRTPMLVRFSDILAQRIREVSNAFAQSIEDTGYQGRYRAVYPIKVNQQRHVVEELIQHGAPFQMGLEAGSKPELLIALALLDTPDAPIVCNGYKDRAYIETALLAQLLGRKPVIVIDRAREVELLIKLCHELGIRPHIGIRGRPSATGAGKWIESTGARSKFGLSPSEVVDVADRLHSEGMLDCLELIHFHIGSQITAIRAHKDALREASRMYIGLRQMGADNLHTIDVGGGLGVDYDGSQSDSNSSMNYSLQEYANDVVDAIYQACEESREAHPDIVSESGRALVAHHSVLIFDILGTSKLRSELAPGRTGMGDSKVTREFEGVIKTLEEGNVQEAYHDALEMREEVNSLFGLGYLSLRQRAEADRHFLHCCERILLAARELPQIPDDLAALETDLADTYFGNFSVFQSAPDHWAVKQLFPIMPIHRLDEAPTRRAVFADLTCDSDGKIDHFIAGQGEQRTIELHELNGEPYFVGVFLVGAYQEILGDLHNLFGDTDAVHVRLDDDGGYAVEHVVDGDEVSDVLRYVQYEPAALVERVRRATEAALRRGDISLADSARLRKHYEEGLRDYTYLGGE
ncbi:MAG: biosynthetic arginine decarboxylase [bacterium]|nr:biosynthetic arginine decarboxylase [bacterium]